MFSSYEQLHKTHVDFLTIMQLAATFQHLLLFSILKFLNAHTVYFDRLIATQKFAS